VGVILKEVVTKKELREFIYLPTKIHSKHPRWVPPVYSEERKYFNPKKNRAFAFCNTILVLALRNGAVIGRIMGIINHRYNSHRKEKNARFVYLESIDEQDVVHALLEHVENWARERGMEKMIGPMGFSDQDPEGFLIEGFEHEPTLATYYNFEYMIQLLDNEDYTKEVDYVVYKIIVPKEIPKFYEKIFERTSKRSDFMVVEFSKRKQLKPYIHPIFELMNDCFKDIYGYMPLNEQEMDDLGRRFLPIVDPRFIKLVETNGEVAAFIIGIPNMSEGIRRSKGRLFPFGIFKILRAAKKTKQLDLLLGGIKEKYRGRGFDVLLGLKMIENAQKARFSVIDSHHQLESNLKMRAEMERLGGQVYKRFRIYQKKLT